MSSAKTPFGDMGLSDQLSQPLDQQLFRRSTPRPELPPAPKSTPAPAPSRPAQVSASAKELARQLKPATLLVKFTLQERPLFDATYPYTQEEREALEDLKIDVSRATDSKVSKNDLVRLALHMLVEDYVVNGEKSYLISKLRKSLS